MAEWVWNGGSWMVANIGPFIGTLPLEIPTYYPSDQDTSVTEVDWVVTVNDTGTLDNGNYIATFLTGNGATGSFGPGVIGEPLDFWVGVNNGTGVAWTPTVVPESLAPPLYAAGGTAPNPATNPDSQDDFADRVILTRRKPSSFDMTGSTLEATETDFWGEPGTGSVWFEFTQTGEYGPFIDINCVGVGDGTVIFFTDGGDTTLNPTVGDLSGFPYYSNEANLNGPDASISFTQLSGLPGWRWWIVIQSNANIKGTIEWYQGVAGPWLDSAPTQRQQGCGGRIVRYWLQPPPVELASGLGFAYSHDHTSTTENHNQHIEGPDIGPSGAGSFYRSELRATQHPGNNSSHSQQFEMAVYVYRADHFPAIFPGHDDTSIDIIYESQQGTLLPEYPAGPMEAQLRIQTDPGTPWFHTVARAPKESYIMAPGDQGYGRIYAPHYDPAVENPGKEWAQYPDSGGGTLHPPGNRDIINTTYTPTPWFTSSGFPEGSSGGVQPFSVAEVGTWDLWDDGSGGIAISMATTLRQPPPEAEPYTGVGTRSRFEYLNADLSTNLQQKPPPINYTYLPPRYRYVYPEPKVMKQPLRQRQRGDGLAISPQRMFQGPSNQVSKQSARRQGWNNTFL